MWPFQAVSCKEASRLVTQLWPPPRLVTMLFFFAPEPENTILAPWGTPLGGPQFQLTPQKEGIRLISKFFWKREATKQTNSNGRHCCSTLDMKVNFTAKCIGRTKSRLYMKTNCTTDYATSPWNCWVALGVTVTRSGLNSQLSLMASQQEGVTIQRSIRPRARVR